MVKKINIKKMMEDYKNPNISSMIFNLSYNDKQRETFFKKKNIRY